MRRTTAVGFIQPIGVRMAFATPALTCPAMTRIWTASTCMTAAYARARAVPTYATWRTCALFCASEVRRRVGLALSGQRYEALLCLRGFRLC